MSELIYLVKTIMQAVKEARDVEVKERDDRKIWAKIVLKVKTLKAKIFAQEDLAKLHLETQNLKEYNTNYKAKRAEMETVARIYMFSR